MTSHISSLNALIKTGLEGSRCVVASQVSSSVHARALTPERSPARRRFTTISAGGLRSPQRPTVVRPRQIAVLSQPMTSARIGLLYFAIVFTFAFAMGIARTLLIAPWLGPTAAVLLEIPIVLLASWFVARRLMRGRPFTRSQCAIIGGTAFVLTMISEAAFSYILRGQGVAQWAGTLLTPLGMVGLAGQAGFAVMPLFAGRRR